ncbi:MAG: thiamine diphosphokinase [Ilumatobacteraceae bacterium]
MNSRLDRHAVIVLGGHPPNPAALSNLDPPFTVICADSGLDHALALRLEPDVVIGDFDSVTAATLNRVRHEGVTVVPHPPDKDRTDAELAIHDALDHGATRISVLWGGGDRIDHVLGVFAALAHPRLAQVNGLEVWMDRDHLHVLHPGVELSFDLPPSTLVSLIPLGSGDVRLTTNGLQWDLTDDVLHGHTARGVSNVVNQSPIRVRVDSGVLAIITPDAVPAERESGIG